MNGWWWYWNTLFGQYGQAGFGIESGSPHTPVTVPFVHPGAPTSPSAFDQPPEYHAQLTPAALSSSPIVVPVCGGSCGLPLNGWYAGWIVFTA